MTQYSDQRAYRHLLCSDNFAHAIAAAVEVVRTASVDFGEWRAKTDAAAVMFAGCPKEGTAML